MATNCQTSYEGSEPDRVEVPITDHFRDSPLDLEKYKAVQFLSCEGKEK